MNSRERLQKFRSYKEGQAVEIARDWEIAHLDPLKERTEKEKSLSELMPICKMKDLNQCFCGIFY